MKNITESPPPPPPPPPVPLIQCSCEGLNFGSRRAILQGMMGMEHTVDICALWSIQSVSPVLSEIAVYYNNLSILLTSHFLQVPLCSVIRFNIEYTLHVISQPMPEVRTYQEINSLIHFLSLICVTLQWVSHSHLGHNSIMPI